ncbi:MAG: hypothetical protein HPY51_10300 [Candidatus Omnitrophica bacterium]|nr:hypothetical protein [Candidatus Omnitrophota bacterium]HPP00152.1 hypothetical protein [bacterium]
MVLRTIEKRLPVAEQLARLVCPIQTQVPAWRGQEPLAPPGAPEPLASQR